ncbi:hypothetical protein ASF28_09770 [Methylobacterium sp. Leaf99]|uniref:hypothetical protein n=1 Tax=Methylobacterium sp. Leaf99 TaxID=1736251 RepID=UPI0006F9776B|nr:hypothetical protein [Methylobacterium sp. Leaf99]KQP11305.1 hypothetical protein ASF28_09770 [Methylobacterium sp. Leaf99]
MNLDRSPNTGGPTRPTATVVTFPAAGRRRFRRADDAAPDPRGAILLFTGIRYERMAEPENPAEPDKRAPRLRRRS